MFCKRAVPSMLAVIAVSQLGATDCGEIIDDPGFDLWCGAELCAWTVDRGEIRQVPTWHRGDDGVALLGPSTAISQLTPVSSGDGNCIRFEMLADVEPTVEVTLALDLDADGTVERIERVPTSDWAPVEFLLKVQAPFDQIRFTLARTGTGNAVLANIGARIADGCGGPPIVSAPPPASLGHGTVDDGGRR